MEFVPANPVWSSCNDRLEVIESFLADLAANIDDPSIDVSKLRAAVAPLDHEVQAVGGIRPTESS